jgi:polyphosphate kinase
MTRNLDDRVEVTCPIYQEDIKSQLIDLFELGWNGNVKARYLSEKLDNKYKTRKPNEPIFRAQEETYLYYKKMVEN